MMWNKIKIDKADAMFSKYIRERDGWRCVRCGKQDPDGEVKKKSSIVQNSHFFSREEEATRFDIENCDCLCNGCHRYWEKHKEKYRDFKVNQLGQERFELLRLRYYTYQKKDRQMEYLKAKALFDEEIKKGE